MFSPFFVSDIFILQLLLDTVWMWDYMRTLIGEQTQLGIATTLSGNMYIFLCSYLVFNGKSENIEKKLLINI